MLLGLSHLSTAKDSTLVSGPEGRAVAYTKGIEFIQKAFKQDNTSSTTAAALANYFLTTGNFDAVLKLSERAIQYADSKAILSEGHLLLARALQGIGQEADAAMEYGAVLKLNPQHPAALLAVAQTLTRAST